MARQFVTFGIRIDQRIAQKLKKLARKDDRKRNRLIERCLAKECGLIDILEEREDG